MLRLCLDSGGVSLGMHWLSKYLFRALKTHRQSLKLVVGYVQIAVANPIYDVGVFLRTHLQTKVIRFEPMLEQLLQYFSCSFLGSHRALRSCLDVELEALKSS